MSVRNNSTGNCVDGAIETFDILPQPVRNKLSLCARNWSPEECRDILLTDGPEFLSELLDEAEQALAEEHYAILASGKPYPK